MPVEFNTESLNSAKAGAKRLTNAVSNSISKFGDILTELIDETSKESFISAMDDDFNTSKALSVLFDLANKANKAKVFNNQTENDIAIYNIGNNKPEKLMDFVTTLEKKLGKEAIKEFLPMQAGDVTRTYADVSELQKDFGFKPDTSIDEGLEQFANWFLEYHGYRK